MEVIVADKAGACYGVERALSLVEKAGDEYPTVHTLGPLIHNPRVVESLERKGIAVAQEVSDITDGAAVIRSHGVPVSVENELKDKGLEIVDATCPFVKRAHNKARYLAEQGYTVVIVGDDGHAEVEGIKSYAGSRVVVTTSVEELVKAELSQKVGVVVQTTQSHTVLTEIVSYLLSVCHEVRVFNTICEATSERQAAAANLSSEVDVMIVVGGKNSGNTQRLFEICSQRCLQAHHIEGKEELKPEWFAGATRVGVTAGASTPASHIEAVVKTLKELSHTHE